MRGDATESKEDACAPPVIAIMPYGTRFGWRLADVPLDRLLWPLGRSADLQGRRVGDLTRDAQILCFPSSALFFLPRWGVRAGVSIVVAEPASVHRRIFRRLRFLHGRFRHVLTRDKLFLTIIPNGAHFNFVNSWITDPAAAEMPKTRNISIIASARNHLDGHRLRHAVIKRLKADGAAVDILGRGYQPFENKAEGLAPYRFSIVIENTREQGYFTEKLLDAFLCKTVPVYWGAPDITGNFDAAGMVICGSLEEIAAAVKKAGAADYEARAGAVARNYQLARQLADPYRRAASLLAGLARQPAEDRPRRFHRPRDAERPSAPPPLIPPASQ
jgi:Glycosyltransferase family 10 (fucosyltransferase) C-term